MHLSPGQAQPDAVEAMAHSCPRRCLLVLPFLGWGRTAWAMGLGGSPETGEPFTPGCAKSTELAFQTFTLTRRLFLKIFWGHFFAHDEKPPFAKSFFCQRFQEKPKLDSPPHQSHQATPCLRLSSPFTTVLCTPEEDGDLPDSIFSFLGFDLHKYTL